ncbi:hypothetical protein C0J52_21350 [Blattella germanica]|nr:hypothetical protein C0J52_21350 [Blattella germanica]
MLTIFYYCFCRNICYVIDRQSDEVQRRINTPNRAYYSLSPIVKNKIISREIKIKIYKTLIRPIIMNGTETWVLNKNTCKQLAVFERKILRRIFGAIETADGWRARYQWRMLR